MLLFVLEPFKYLDIEVRQLVPEFQSLRLDELNESLQATHT